MATVTRDLTGQVDGLATSFVTPEPFAPGSLVVHLNGARLVPVDEYAETGASTFVWVVTAPTPAPAVGDTLLVQYEVTAFGDTVLFPLVVASGIDPTL